MLLKACVNGSSELMTNLSMSLVNILYNYQLLRFAGEDGVAAYGVIMYASFLFVAVFVGYAVGSAPIVSFHYGARNRAEVHNLYQKSLRLIAVVSVTLTAASMVIIPYVARIFVGYDVQLLALTSRAFRLYALCFLIKGFNIYASSFFTALNDGMVSAIISFLRTFVGRLKADSQAVGDGEHLALHAVGPQDAVDALLHPKGLRPGHGQMVAHGGRQVGEQIVIHTHLL